MEPRCGRGGDEGIDGVIREDRLGLETIYVQAKRWENKVDIQRFAGALRVAPEGFFRACADFPTKESVAPPFAATTRRLVEPSGGCIAARRLTMQ